MKKTSNRLAVTGAAILLGACAIALAQHDSRKRERESPDSGMFAGEVAKPISTSDDFASLGGDSVPSRLPTPQIVRGNDGHLEDTNPLRENGYGGSYGSESAVVPAAALGASLGEVPALPNSGSLPGTAPSYDSLPTAPNAMGSFPQPPSSYNSGAATGSLSDSASPDLPTELPAAGLPSGLPDHPNGDTGYGMAAPSLPTLGGLPATSPSAGASTSYGQEAYSPPSGAQGYDQTGYGNESLSPANATDGYGNESYSQADDSNQTTAPPAYEPPQADSMASTVGIGGQQVGGSQTVYDGNAYGQPTAGPIRQVPASPAAYGGGSPPGVNAATAAPAPSPGGMLGPRRTPGSLASLVSDMPGNRYLDGPQTPNVTIEIRAPGEEIQVGKKAAFVITVSNRGSVDALDVTVVDKVPRGTQFTGSEPQPASSGGDLLVWELGRIPAGEDRVIRMNVVPQVEGEIGSTASLMFASQASTRVLATQPKLELAVESAPNVLIGDQQKMVLVIRNSGSGIARNVKLTVDVPENLSHPSGASIEGVLADLHPNESRRIDTLVFSAIQPGIADCLVRVLTDDGVQAQQSVAVDVRAPKLVAQIQGPKERYLQREATYTVAVANTGTATATQLEFAVHLPAGFAYVGCDKPAATYDRARHVVLLRLAELPASAKAPFQISLLPIELGNQSISVKTTGDLGIVADASAQVTVNGRAELDFTIGQDNGQIEVGATTTYEVRVLNKGDKPDRNVTLVIDLPQGATVLDISPTGAVSNGNQIQFPPIAEMPIRDARTYRFVVQHNQSGTQKVGARLISENLSVGVTKEVPTFVYQDD